MRPNRDLIIGETLLYGVEIDAGLEAPVLLFVHGGPGSHCHNFAAVLRGIPAYTEAPFTWVLYDQRGCGRSKSEGPVRHEDNVGDLVDVIAFMRETYGRRFAGIVGHSYGGWLLSDAVRAAAIDQLPPCVMVAIDTDRYQTRYRNLMIELVEAKVRAPEMYRQFFSNLPEIGTADSWRIKDDLRAYAYLRDVRRHFYWADLDAMTWYEAERKSVSYGDDDAVFLTVRDSMYECDPKPIDPLVLPRGSFRIMGLQDFIMHGGILREDSFTTYFQRSGHYPHIEQPREFLRVLGERLEL